MKLMPDEVAALKLLATREVFCHEQITGVQFDAFRALAFDGLAENKSDLMKGSSWTITSAGRAKLKGEHQ